MVLLQLQFFIMFIYFELIIERGGAKGDWDFRISDLVKNPDGTDV